MILLKQPAMSSKENYEEDIPDQALMISVISERTVIHGSIDNAKAIRIEGTIIGNIEQADTVVIGTTGRIRGNINAKRLIVFGHIEGDILASESVSIKSSGQITGKLTTQSLSLDDGATYDGEIIMIPLSL